MLRGGCAKGSQGKVGVLGASGITGSKSTDERRSRSPPAEDMRKHRVLVFKGQGRIGGARQVPGRGPFASFGVSLRGVPRTPPPRRPPATSLRFEAFRDSPRPDLKVWGRGLGGGRKIDRPRTGGVCKGLRVLHEK